MYRSIPPISRVVSIVFVITSSYFSYYKGGLSALILSAVLWAVAIFFAPRIKTLKLDNYFVLYSMLIVTSMIAASAPFLINYLGSGRQEDEKVEDTEETSVLEDTQVPGTILVEAGDGLLGGEDSFSYIGQSARGMEAYLADKGITATYNVESPGGYYSLLIKVNDDGMHADGARSARVTINGSQIATYEHVSKVIDGWEWFRLGNFDLKAGSNEVIFEKLEATSAAFVMDEFKFIPK